MEWWSVAILLSTNCLLLPSMITNEIGLIIYRLLYMPAKLYRSSKTFTPFQPMFLRQPRMGIHILNETCTATEFSSPDEYAQVMRERMKSAYQIAHDHLKSVFARAKRRYDVRVRECQVKVGDRVWYFSPRKYRNRSLNGHLKHRDHLKWYGK
jgi:hypothetical protein